MDVDGCDSAQHYAALVSRSLGPLAGGNGSALHGSSLGEQTQENGRMPKVGACRRRGPAFPAIPNLWSSQRAPQRLVSAGA